MGTRRMNNQVLEVCDSGGGVILSMAEELRDGVLCMELAGQLKNEAAHDFEDELMAALSVCGKLSLDFGQVTYIASMALASLLSIQQMIDEMDGAGMVLRNVRPEVMEVFQSSGFSEILQIQEEAKP